MNLGSNGDIPFELSLSTRESFSNHCQPNVAILPFENNLELYEL